MEKEIEIIEENLEQEIEIQNENIGLIPSGTKQIIENGTYDVEKYKYAEVNTPIPTGTTNITINGEYNVYDYATVNVNVPEPTGTIQITSNGETNVKDYEIANVNVPQPSGTINITANGEYDVSQYANANVNTPAGLNWNALGYDSTPQKIIDDYNYSLEIKNNWTPNSSLSQKFYNDTKLVYMPLVDTSITTNMYGMFWGCSNLVSVPQLDLSNNTSTRYMFSSCGKLVQVPVLDMSKNTIPQSMFENCPSLNDESLDNILKMCINFNPNYSLTKTLSYMGIKKANYPASRIQALPSYQNFINAGWTIGY